MWEYLPKPTVLAYESTSGEVGGMGPPQGQASHKGHTEHVSHVGWTLNLWPHNYDISWDKLAVACPSHGVSHPDLCF